MDEEFDYRKMYYKITNKEENHNGYQYHDGLNVDPNPWSDEICSAGGFYFSDIKNIFRWARHGDIEGYVREITVPEDALVSIEKNKFKANKIILGKKMKLWNIDTFKHLIEQGADIHVGDENALQYASMNGHLDVVKYLVEQGADIHAEGDFVLRLASMYGHLDTVKYLAEQGADTDEYRDHALVLASMNGHLDVVKYLVEQGADIHAQHNNSLRVASRNGHLNVVNYLKSLK